MDFYLDDNNCIERLVKEYNEHKSLIVAIDFDDTIFDFHKKGREYNNVISLLQEAEKLNMKLIINTCNSNHSQIIEYCMPLFSIYGINKQIVPKFEGTGKLYYNILLDDRAGLSASYNILKEVIKKIKEEQ